MKYSFKYDTDTVNKYHGSLVHRVRLFKFYSPDCHGSSDRRNRVTLPGMSAMCRTRPCHRSSAEGFPASHVVSSIFTKGKDCTRREARTITASSHWFSRGLKNAIPSVVYAPWQGTKRLSNRSSVWLNDASAIRRSLTQTSIRSSGRRRWTSIPFTVSNEYLSKWTITRDQRAVSQLRGRSPKKIALSSSPSRVTLLEDKGTGI